MNADLLAICEHLGRVSAHAAWQGREADTVPNEPTPDAWLKLEQALGLVEPEHHRALTDEERRVFKHAYRNELHALAGRGAP